MSYIHFVNCKQTTDINRKYATQTHFGVPNMGLKVHRCWVMSSWKVKNTTRTSCTEAFSRGTSTYRGLQWWPKWSRGRRKWNTKVDQYCGSSNTVRTSIRYTRSHCWSHCWTWWKKGCETEKEKVAFLLTFMKGEIDHGRTDRQKWPLLWSA